MLCVLSHQSLGPFRVQEKKFWLKEFISLEEINLSRHKENNRFYLFDKSWYFPAKHVTYGVNHIQTIHFGRYIVGYTVENHVFSSTCRLNYQMYIL